MVNIMPGKAYVRIPSPDEHAMLISLFERGPLFQIPLIDLCNTLQTYGVSFSCCAEQVDPEIPALAIIAFGEIRRRLCNTAAF